MIDFIPYLNDDKLPIMNREQFEHITEKYGKEKFREELSEYISQARPPFPYKYYSKQQMVSNFLKLKSFDTTTNLIPKDKLEKKVFEKYDDYGHNFDKYGLGVIDSASTYNICSNYFMEQLRLRCPCYSFDGPADVWENGTAKDIWGILGALWRGVSMRTLEPSNYLLSIRLGTYIATQFKPVVAKAIYDITNAKTVLDTSCGWGDRLAGFFASDAEEYYGCDPNPNTYEIYQHQISQYNKLLSKPKKVTIWRCGAEDLPYHKLPKIDCAFTSPPYFSTEQYNKGGEHEQDQSWAKFNEYDKWRDDFYLPVAEKTMEVSKFMFVNIMDPKINGKRYRSGDELVDKFRDKFLGQIGMRIMQRPKSDKLFESEQEKADFMNKMFIENVWCFGPKTDLFKNSRKATLDEFFA